MAAGGMKRQRSRKCTVRTHEVVEVTIGEQAFLLEDSEGHVGHQGEAVGVGLAPLPARRGEALGAARKEPPQVLVRLARALEHVRAQGQLLRLAAVGVAERLAELIDRRTPHAAPLRS